MVDICEYTMQTATANYQGGPPDWGLGRGTRSTTLRNLKLETVQSVLGRFKHAMYMTNLTALQLTGTLSFAVLHLLWNTIWHTGSAEDGTILPRDSHKN
jgi:hypothetical protein